MTALSPPPLSAHPSRRAQLTRGLRGPRDGAMLRRLADAVRPRRRVRPSEWARKNVVLTREQSARPGPFNPDVKPFGADMHDVMFDHPDKLGTIWVKPGQIGASQIQINLTGCEIDTDPAPTLYITTDDNKAKEFSDERVKPMLRRSKRIGQLVEEAASEDRRKLLISFPFPGGRLNLVGAGSESKLVGTPYRRVRIDEYDVVCKEFPGDPWKAAKVRTYTYRGQEEISAWSHPKRMGEGIEKLYAEESDMQAWVFDCPHCAGRVNPMWRTCIRFTRTEELPGGQVRQDPKSAVFACPCCGETITDQQRARALWKPTQREGGTGRFECVAPGGPQSVADRRWAGRRTHRLADPDVTVRELAVDFVSCTTEEALVEFFGKQLGEGYEAHDQTLTLDTLRENFADRPTQVAPGGKFGVKFVVAGADVQWPEHDPTHVVPVVAYAASGMAYVMRLERISGYAAFHELLRRVEVPLDDGRGGGIERRLAISCVGVDDAGKLGGAIKDACRASLYAAATSAWIQLVPVRFVAGGTLNRDLPFRLRGEDKRRHPTRPDLGLMDMFDLYRHAWIDRVLKRLAQKRYMFLCERPPDLEEDLTSQVLTKKNVRNPNWQDPELEWDKSEKRRDDWLTGLAYAEAVAAIVMGLDRIHEMAEGERGGEGDPYVIAPSW